MFPLFQCNLCFWGTYIEINDFFHEASIRNLLRFQFIQRRLSVSIEITGLGLTNSISKQRFFQCTQPFLASYIEKSFCDLKKA